MSEPWIPQPAPQDAPGPHPDLWTLVLRDHRDGSLRRVPVFARSLEEARAQLDYERDAGEILIRVDQGGTLPVPR